LWRRRGWRQLCADWTSSLPSAGTCGMRPLPEGRGRRRAYLDWGKFTSMCRLAPHGGMSLEICSICTLLRVAAVAIHSLLVPLEDRESE
jgi:hypothetical protein